MLGSENYRCACCGCQVLISTSNPMDARDQRSSPTLSPTDPGSCLLVTGRASCE